MFPPTKKFFPHLKVIFVAITMKNQQALSSLVKNKNQELCCSHSFFTLTNMYNTRAEWNFLINNNKPSRFAPKEIDICNILMLEQCDVLKHSSLVCMCSPQS